MDWFKGKSPGNYRHFHEICGFPAIFLDEILHPLQVLVTYQMRVEVPPSAPASAPDAAPEAKDAAETEKAEVWGRGAVITMGCLQGTSTLW